MSRKLNLTNAALLGRAGNRAAALFGVDDDRSLRELDMAAITPNPLQPRRNFDETAIAALAASIDRHGLLQPICVRETQANHYQIVAGERRWRAFRQLERKTIPALVIKADDPNTLALIENLQREDLDGLETANALSILLQERGLTHEQLGALIGKSQAYVSRMLGMLSLPRSILDDYAANRHVPASAAMIVAETKDPKLQAALWEQAKAGLSVRALTEARKMAETEVLASEEDEGPVEQAGRRPARTLSANAALRAAQKGTEALRLWRGRGEGLSAEQAAALRALRDEIDALLG
ncbi:MAG TPA: ParB/RepB/Spo0J family partition protein [Azospirillaceae bacterium]|nr:ParB/RepB/Spo0J family partition protein [Azospirillaceae bacterium]